MNILAVDTALSACSVAILMGNRSGPDRTVVRSTDMARGHAEALMPMLAEALEDAAIGYSDIDRFVVTIGPGTFTGVRVGVAAARGMALVTGRPAVGVTTLEALAATARANADCPAGPLLVAMDARRDEIYAQAFGSEGAAGEPMVVAIADLLRDLPGDVARVFGSAAEAVAEAALAQGRTMTVLGTDQTPDPVVIAQIGRDREIGPAPRPLYLRPPDAKPQTQAALARN